MSYADTGLPQNPMVEKAWSLVNTDIGALWSAQVLAESCDHPDVEMLAAHFVAFASRSAWTTEKIAHEFSGRTADIVEGMRAVYDKMGGKPAGSADDAVKLSFLALAIVDLEYQIREYGKVPVDNILIDTSLQDESGKPRAMQDSVRALLQRAYDKYTLQIQPLVGTTSEPGLERRFTNALDAIKTKLQAKPEPRLGERPKYSVS